MMFEFEGTLLPHMPSVTEDGARLFSGRWKWWMSGLRYRARLDASLR